MGQAAGVRRAYDSHPIVAGRDEVAVVHHVAAPAKRRVLEASRQHDERQSGDIVLRREDVAVRTRSARAAEVAAGESLGFKERQRTCQGRGARRSRSASEKTSATRRSDVGWFCSLSQSLISPLPGRGPEEVI